MYNAVVVVPSRLVVVVVVVVVVVDWPLLSHPVLLECLEIQFQVFLLSTFVCDLVDSESVDPSR